MARVSRHLHSTQKNPLAYASSEVAPETQPATGRLLVSMIVPDIGTMTLPKASTLVSLGRWTRMKAAPPERLPPQVSRRRSHLPTGVLHKEEIGRMVKEGKFVIVHTSFPD
jgi:hypothetical protein